VGQLPLQLPQHQLEPGPDVQLLEDVVLARDREVGQRRYQVRESAGLAHVHAENGRDLVRDPLHVVRQRVEGGKDAGDDLLDLGSVRLGLGHLLDDGGPVPALLLYGAETDAAQALDSGLNGPARQVETVGDAGADANLLQGPWRRWARRSPRRPRR
jgi:hypothetical protein